MITLTTDFGIKDPYVAEMKAAILGINPQANIIDISHLVDKFSVRIGGFILASAAPYFPQGTVHLGVIDPGVGTKRRAILIETQQAFYVGPDNGVLMLAAQTQGIKHIYRLSNPQFMRQEISNTFHGRDIFAPAAAYLDMGVKPQEFGEEITDPITPEFATVKRSKNGSIIGRVLHIDDFGNIITNIKPTKIKAQIIKVNLHHVSLEVPYAKTYGEVKPHEPLSLIGSHGFLEFALNMGSFSKKYRINNEDQIEVVGI